MSLLSLLGSLGIWRRKIKFRRKSSLHPWQHSGILSKTPSALQAADVTPLFGLLPRGHRNSQWTGSFLLLSVQLNSIPCTLAASKSCIRQRRLTSMGWQYSKFSGVSGSTCSLSVQQKCVETSKILSTQHADPTLYGKPYGSPGGQHPIDRLGESLVMDHLADFIRAIRASIMASGWSDRAPGGLPLLLRQTSLPAGRLSCIAFISHFSSFRSRSKSMFDGRIIFKNSGFRWFLRTFPGICLRELKTKETIVISPAMKLTKEHNLKIFPYRFHIFLVHFRYSFPETTP